MNPLMWNRRVYEKEEMIQREHKKPTGILLWLSVYTIGPLSCGIDHSMKHETNQR